MLFKVLGAGSITHVSEFGYLQACRAIEQSEIALFFDILVEDLLPIRADLDDHFAEFIILKVVLGGYDAETHQPHTLLELVVRGCWLREQFDQ